MKSSQLVGGIGLGINTQTDSYTLALSDAGKRVRMNKGTANTLTVPLNSSVGFDVGTIIEVAQVGAGATTIAAAVGVTITVIATKTLVLAGRYGVAKLVKVDTNTWELSGDLTAV